jgi:hypothetical protein
MIECKSCVQGSIWNHKSSVNKLDKLKSKMNWFPDSRVLLSGVKVVEKSVKVLQLHRKR